MSVQDETEKAVALAKRALKRCDEQQDEIDALRNELRDARDQNEQLRRRLADLEERDSLVDSVVDAKRLKVEERAALCIQTAANQAFKRRQRGEPGKAELDYRGADSVTGGKLDRRQLLDALERAATLVDSDAVRFVKEARHAQQNSRLIVDLDAGDLPTELAGVPISAGVS